MLRKVMLVDDEEDIRTIAEISLSQIGQWETLLASSGQEAIELAAKEAPDLILLDVMMPGMDGPNVLRRLRENESTQAIPVVFLTAKVQPQEINEYVSLGALGVIAKPFDPLTLPAQIQAFFTE